MDRQESIKQIYFKSEKRNYTNMLKVLIFQYNLKALPPLTMTLTTPSTTTTSTTSKVTTAVENPIIIILCV